MLTGHGAKLYWRYVDFAVPGMGIAIAIARGTVVSRPVFDECLSNVTPRELSQSTLLGLQMISSNGLALSLTVFEL